MNRRFIFGFSQRDIHPETGDRLGGLFVEIPAASLYGAERIFRDCFDTWPLLIIPNRDVARQLSLVELPWGGGR